MAKKIRIIIDTNLWISFLITKRYDFLDDLIESNKVKLIFSRELLEEFSSVVTRPKFRKFFTQEDIDLILDIFGEYSELIEVTSQVDICRDIKDNFLLSLAKDGKADFLITGDKDLLVLKK
nr:putative toxin-antitoxin system toxin component, PIN family [Candidatus Delongbacteria bacterium]